MKKTLLLVFVCAVLAACGKDEPFDLPKPAPAAEKEKVEEPKAEPEKPGDPEPEKPGNPEPEQPTPAPEVTKENMVAYFGFESKDDVNTNIARTKNLKGAQKIGEKTIEVVKADLVSKDEKTGSFVLSLEGKVDNKEFKKQFTFDGFAKRLEDYYMGNRAQARWKEGIDKYAKFDLDYLLRVKKTDKFTAQYLSEMVDFYSSNLDGTLFYYTPEDIAKTILSDVKYESDNGGGVSFTLTYAGVRSAKPIHLDINTNTYYSLKVAVDTDFPKDKYVRGVKENYDVFGAGTVKYDNSQCVVQCVGANSVSESTGELILRYNLIAKQGDDEPLASFSKEIKGFKLLKELKNELVPQFTSEVQEVMKKYIKADMPLGDVKNLIKTPIDSWIKKVKFSIVRNGHWHELSWEDNGVLKGNRQPVMDVYLDRPRFELLSAVLKNDNGRKMLELNIKLLYVNETSVEGDNVILPLRIHIPSK